MTVESHLDRTIRWMKHDVKVCMDNDAPAGALTLMLAYIAALAGYLVGRTDESNVSDYDEFMRFYSMYLKDAFPDITPPVEGNKKRKSLIYTHFRCGLIHEHLMKKGTAVDNDPTKPAYYIEKNLGAWVLNTWHFYKHFVEALDAYALAIKEGKEPLKTNFIKRAQYLGVEGSII